VKREWKPGDVAMVELPEGSERPAVLIGVDTGCLCWHSAVSGDFRCLDFDAVAARPLAVIDPEHREQVERLIRLQDKHFNDGIREVVNDFDLRDMQAALREYADPKPPRPEEPTGLGAVVEDAEGVRFVRTGVDGWEWTQVGTGGPICWAYIDAVRVLSEGVAP
jgi:hypothetical protein